MQRRENRFGAAVKWATEGWLAWSVGGLGQSDSSELVTTANC